MEVVVKLIAIVVALLVIPACTESESVPSCMDVGCVEVPSGSPDIWTPCTASTCFCRVSDTETVECQGPDLPACPVLGCTVPQCNDAGCFCDGLACVPTGIPAPIGGAL